MSKPRVLMQIVPVDAVSQATWDEVWQLTRRFYDTARPVIEPKLKAHDSLALFRSAADDNKALVGMAAIAVERLDFQGERLLMIFTSHTIVEEAYRGSNLIQRAGFRTFLKSCLRHPWRRKFWIFDTFSYKSYLLLPRNLATFWPRHDMPTPPWEAALMGHYGQQKYGAAWQADGVVMRSSEKRLLSGVAALDASLLRNPDIAFFARRNPAHAQGDMLLCLCPLSLANWWAIASKAIGRLRKRAR